MENKITELLKKEDKRLITFTKKIEIGDQFIYYDYSKTHLTKEILSSYFNKFKEIKLKERVNEMFDGKKINFTEDRKVLHVSLRDKLVLEKILKGEDAKGLTEEKADIYEQLVKMKQFAKKFEDKKLLGATGKVLDTIVNIGIGGSDLGPRMVTQALQFYKNEGTSVHFISNVDATDALLVFEKIDPEKTLFIIVSKTFTTQETLSNAILAKMIFAKKTGLKEEAFLGLHFVAISSNDAEVKKFGIETVFSMGDYVGGRYSLWSTVGLSICLYIGYDNFLLLLKGAQAMDEHFITAKEEENIPIIHASVELFYSENNFDNKCILPYDTYLTKLPFYLQQAEMESNGKTAKKDGTAAAKSGLIIWGGVGTDSQHSFFQLLHQGTRNILSEFLIALNPVFLCCEKRNEHQKMLFANFVAQTEALMVGKEDENLHKNFEGNKPSISIIYSKLTPDILGAIISMYEQKIFAQGVYWDINSYDQFGVELGKVLAKKVLGDLSNENEISEHDISTTEQINLFIRNSKN